jgi:hypothetical protein
MEFGFSEYYAIGLLVVFVIKAVAVNRDARIRAYNLYLNTSIFLLIAIFLSYQFYKDGLYTGIAAVALGGLAIGKYFYDMEVSNQPDEDQDKEEL